jgi:hypothetical protein
MEIVPLLLELSDVQTSRPCARVYLIVRRARNLNLGQNQRNVDQFAPNSARMKKAPQAAKSWCASTLSLSVISLPAYDDLIAASATVQTR